MVRLRAVVGASVLVACATGRRPTPSPRAVAQPSASSVAPGAVVLPHGAVPFTPAPMPSVTWPVAHWADSCPPCERTLAESVCNPCGGHWYAYMLGGGVCGCPTKDAGKPCRDERDCNGNVCALSWEDALAHGHTRCNDQFCVGAGKASGLPWGECRRWDAWHSCVGWLQTVDTPTGIMRETRWICTD